MGTSTSNNKERRIDIASHIRKYKQIRPDKNPLTTPNRPPTLNPLPNPRPLSPKRCIYPSAAKYLPPFHTNFPPKYTPYPSPLHTHTPITIQPTLYHPPYPPRNPTHPAKRQTGHIANQKNFRTDGTVRNGRKSTGCDEVAEKHVMIKRVADTAGKKKAKRNEKRAGGE